MELCTEDFQRLKRLELDILKSFIDVCKSLNLDYYLIGGSALGAVRHKGFIPWDDDIDIGMKRKDYEIFVKKAQHLFPKNILVQTHDNEPEWFMHFCKIRRTDSIFIEKSVKHLNMNHGVFIDVFPLDSCKRSKLPFSFKLLSLVENQFLKNQTPLRRIKCFLAKILTMTFSVKGAYRKKEAILSKLKGGAFIANCCGSYGDKEFVPSFCFDDHLKLMFEGLEVNVPIDYDTYLKKIYGDYMALPPEEKRIPHHYVEYFVFPKDE